MKYVLALLLLPVAAMAQGTRTDYARAEQLLGWNATELVLNDAPRVRWLPGDRFWYRNRGEKGYEFLMADASTGAKRPVFDHVRLAAALSEAADTTYEPYKLPFRDFTFEDGERAIRFSVARAKFWKCELTTYACTGPDSVAPNKTSEVRSPDGKWFAFERGGNLYLRSASGSATNGGTRSEGVGSEEIPLTSDGTADYGYAIANIGCCAQITTIRNKTELRPFVLWSPDSKRLLTHRFDQRGVRQMHLVETKNPGPILHSYRYALPGDSVIPKVEYLIVDIGTRGTVKLDQPPQDAVNTTCCWFRTDTVWKDVRWTAAGDAVFFTQGKRGYKELVLHTADASTGKTRAILTESSKTFVETNQNSGGIPNWRPISGGREIVWWSERDGWGHLYLIDAATGAVKNRITAGDWLVSDLLWVDDAQRTVYFTARGRERGDPYFRYLYRARLDGTGLERLTSEEGDHDIQMAPSGKFLIDSYSRPDAAPVTVIRRADGTVVRELQRGDLSRLLAVGWTMPEALTLKARDGHTELRALLWRPTHFDSTKRYPIIDYIYPGPQIGSISSRQFTASPSGNARALAELGFLVLQVDALGTPGRSKAFHDFYYGNMGDNGIPDHITAIKQVALKYPQVDLDRVGIFGHSGGGFSSTDAILRHPDFFKVAVSSAGNHDNRSYDYTWGEKYHGVLKKLSDTTDSFDSQSNWRLANNLRGKLLLMYGTLDDNVHPNATLLLVDELIKANKEFDMLVLPNRNHGFASEPYVVKRTWDYFVEHLLGKEPPAGYVIRRPVVP
ncbi:MAG TPA: DPP IV N-terminal domain-containing protein [Gemmatimonadaceae bacterium]|nr:DPP IV N-terminal domain-containing protein [Gemmatimonadaceae bacterium]